MGLVTIYEGTAADYALEENIMADHWSEKDNWRRKVVRWSLGGSDALEECEIDLYYGKFLVGTIKNSQTTGALTDDDMVPISSRFTCRQGEKISAVLKGSVSATTPLKLVLDIKDMGMGRRR